MSIHTKIGKFKKKQVRSTTFLNLFDNQDKLTFAFSEKSYDSKIYRRIMTFCLSTKVNKKGERKINFYRISENSVRVVNSWELAYTIFCNMVSRNKKFKSKSILDAIPKVWVSRIKKQLKLFCKRNKISFNSSSSKNIFDQMVIMCYPGYQIFNEEFYKNLPPSRFAKKDLVKSILKTNGKTTKRKFFDYVNKDFLKLHVKHRDFEVIYRLRVNYGIDFVQEFLTKSISPSFPSGLILNCSHFNRYRMRELINSKSNYLLDITSAIRSLKYYNIFPDFTRYSSIKEMHDELTLLLRNVIRESRQRSRYFSVLINLKTLVINFNNFFPEYTLKFPQDLDELNEWASYMHNCISGYCSRISNSYSNILGIFKGDTLLYNLDITNNNMLTQAMGRFNKKIPNEDKVRLEKLFNESVIQYNNAYW